MLRDRACWVPGLGRIDTGRPGSLLPEANRRLGHAGSRARQCWLENDAAALGDRRSVDVDALESEARQIEALRELVLPRAFPGLQ